MLSAHFSSAFRSPSSSICFWHLRHFRFDNFSLLKLLLLSLFNGHEWKSYPTDVYVLNAFHHFIFALYSAHTRFCDYVRNIKHNLVKYREREWATEERWKKACCEMSCRHVPRFIILVWRFFLLFLVFNSMMRFVLYELCTHKFYRLRSFILHYNIISFVNPFMLKACIYLLSSLCYLLVVFEFSFVLSWMRTLKNNRKILRPLFPEILNFAL